MYRKTLSLHDCDIKLAEGSGHFAGYASVFDGVDAYGDTILKGAYEQTLKKHGKPKMYVQHNSYELPIGKWLSVKEDDHGLAVEGEFTPGMARADETRAALQHGTVDGLSIGYMLKKDDYKETENGGRIIRRVSHLLEISVVTFPADEAARIDLASVKSEDIEQLETIRDFERFLRETGTFSKGLTEALVRRAKVIFAQGEPVDDDADAKKAVKELESAIVKVRRKIKTTLH